MVSRFHTAVLRNGFVVAALIAVPAAVALAATPAAPTPVSSSLFSTASVGDALRDVRYQPEGLSSSADEATADSLTPTLGDERESLAGDAAQPGPGRRSYGRSRYQDRWHNADGSNKIAIVGGAGLTLPVGNTGKYYTPSYTITAGAGWNFNKMFGILGEFHYDHMNLTTGSLNYQYNNYINNYGATSGDLTGLDGNAHVVALTVNPIVNFTGAGRHSKVGAYVTGGVGFYHKATNFTLPQEVDSYYYSYVTNANIETYSANGFGVNGGIGLTYKLSEFSSTRLFAEARYNWIDLGSNSSESFPYNRRNTEYIPVTVGIRF